MQQEQVMMLKEVLMKLFALLLVAIFLTIVAFTMPASGALRVTLVIFAFGVDATVAYMLFKNASQPPSW